MPIDRIYVYLATACFFGGFVFALQALRGNQSRTPWINLSVMGVGFVLQCLFLAERGKAVRQCPVTNTFELLVFVAWCLVLLYFVIGATYRWSLLGLFTAPLAFLLQLMAILAPDPAPPVIGPVHFWNELHKSVSLLSYGAFGLACVAGVMFLIQDHQLKKRRLNNLSFNLPPIHYLHQATRRLILFGFVLLSVGIIAAFLFAFSLSFDEFVRTLLLTGFDRTLPVQFWYMIVETLAPEAPAMAVLIIVISVISSLAGFAFSNRSSKTEPST